ncbi:MAG: adenylosuccinate synthase [Saprospiraceae bacterium]|nr:adenylosuccinate synthase [Saprospiraceae bacterium]
MYVDVLLGLQWGDEGKGKVVDYIADQYDVVCRFQGGPNAGHTIIIGDKKFVLHTIPSGVFRSNIINVVGNGVVLDPITFKKELANLDTVNIEYKSRLYISQKAHLILPSHRLLDAASEASKGATKIGSTLKGIGPTYMDKTGRNGLRVGDIFLHDFEAKYRALKEKHLGLIKLYPQVEFDLAGEEAKWFESLELLRSLNSISSEYFLNDLLSKGKRILAEGAQGSMLDIDYGTYPYVTSSNTIAAGVCNGLGIPPAKVREVIGIAKAYCTRVGGGPFPTELENETGETLRRIGMEFGATTGRPRRCGWIDIPQLKYVNMLNGVTQIVITKLDVLNDFDEIEVGTSYKYDGKETHELPFDLCTTAVDVQYTPYQGWKSDLSECKTFESLPKNASDYILELERLLETKISIISTGPERSQLIIR